jgi:hypothetical protein
MANSTNEVNIYNLTRKLREQRPRMVNKTVKLNSFTETASTQTKHFRRTIY